MVLSTPHTGETTTRQRPARVCSSVSSAPWMWTSGLASRTPERDVLDSAHTGEDILCTQACVVRVLTLVSVRDAQLRRHALN